MKKILTIIILIVLSVSLVSCTKVNDMDKEDKAKKESRKEQLKSSENLLKEYLELSMQGKSDEAEKMIDKAELSKKIFDISNNIKLLGYKIQNVEKVGSIIEATVDITVSDKEKPYTSISNVTYKLKDKNNKILITNVEENKGIVFFQDIVEGEPSFMIGEGKKAKVETAFTSKDLPSYISVKTNYLQEEKVKVSDKYFGAVAISGDSRQMVISSVENGNTLLLVIEKSLKVSSSGSLSADSKGKSQGGSNKGSNQDTKYNEEVELEGIDYFENSSVEYIAFSPNNKVLWAQIKSGDKLGISIYSASSKEILCKNIMEKFNSPEYTITNAYFNNENTLILQAYNLKEKKSESYVLDVLEDRIIKQDY